jgi:transposase-like protein
VVTWNGYNEWDSSKRDLDKEKGSPDMVDQKHSRKYSEEFKRQIVQLHDKG